MAEKANENELWTFCDTISEVGDLFVLSELEEAGDVSYGETAGR